MKGSYYTDEYLKANKFGHFTFIARAPSVKKKTKCLWRCDCGNEVVRLTTEVIRGNVGTCGCSRKKKNEKSARWRGYGDISGAKWGIILNGAKNRKIAVEITIQEAWQQFLKQNRKCALTGEDLQFDSGHRSGDGTASLDRIDPAKGYIDGNVQWVHRDVNWMKSNFSQVKFVSWCEKVADHNRGLDKAKTFDIL